MECNFLCLLNIYFYVNFNCFSEKVVVLGGDVGKVKQGLEELLALDPLLRKALRYGCVRLAPAVADASTPRFHSFQLFFAFLLF